jgi:chromosome segregation ATPase
MTHKLLKESVVEEKTAELKTLEKQAAELEETELKNRKELSVLNNKKLSLETEIKETETETRKLDSLIRFDAKERLKRQQQIQNLTAEHKANSREQKIQDAIKERTDFYSALLARLKRLQEELIVSGINCRPPKAVILEFQNTIEKGGISDYTVFMRDAKGRYDQHIRKQAENLIDGIKISTKEQLSMNDYLDRFLRHDRVIESWG